MAEKIYVSDVGNHAEQEITLKGWLYNKRHSGKLWFLLVRDGTATVRVESWLGRHVVRSLIETEGVWVLVLPQ